MALSWGHCNNTGEVTTSEKHCEDLLGHVPFRVFCIFHIDADIMWWTLLFDKNGIVPMCWVLVLF